MKIIERAWQSYLRGVVPKDASNLQIKETRRAFYSGSAILFSVMTGAHFFDDAGPAGPADPDPTDDDLLTMQMIQDEVDAFGAELDLAVLGIRKH